MNGVEPAKISSILASSPRDDFIANTTIPKGGVSSPISIVTMETMVNQIGS